MMWLHGVLCILRQWMATWSLNIWIPLVQLTEAHVLELGTTLSEY